MEEIVTIDTAGRIVVPESMRERLRLRAGGKLLLREEDGIRLVIEPIAEQGAPVEADGLLAICGRLVGRIPVRSAS